MIWLKGRPDQVELVRDCYFDDPLTEASDRYYRSGEWEAVRSLVGVAGGRALDVGAGNGISSYALTRDGWQTTALEPDPSSIVGAGAIRQLSLEFEPPIAVVEGWGESLPFPDASFDLVFGRQVLHHARSLRVLCAEMARVLKPGGLFLATREHVIFKDGDLEVFLEKHPLHMLYGGENAYRLSEYKDAIYSAGIKLVQVINPLASDVNLHPQSRETIAASVHARLPFVPASFVTPFLLRNLGWVYRSPGAQYSFFGARKEK